MSTSIVAVRGAVSVGQDPNETQEMISAVGRLIQDLETANEWRPDDLVSIQFTQTSDLKRMNAAAALRAARPDYSRVPLFCAQEPDIDGAPSRLVRILVTWRGGSSPTPVYIGEASALRPDLFGEE
ncbi:MAG: chorismate mutase [Spirochaetaceae bacterium]|nr:chorismate mutase [Spirochaetaceae bacterium]MDT8298788.1 chorismate mutase [Spirochaetaceae bacterium]